MIGCESSEPEGGQVQNAITDTEAMQQATAAANKIIRNASDCEAVLSNIDGVMATLDELQGGLQTEAGATSMESLKKQVENVANTCGVG